MADDQGIRTQASQSPQRPPSTQRRASQYPQRPRRCGDCDAFALSELTPCASSELRHLALRRRRTLCRSRCVLRRIAVRRGVCSGLIPARFAKTRFFLFFLSPGMPRISMVWWGALLACLAVPCHAYFRGDPVLSPPAHLSLLAAASAHAVLSAWSTNALP